MVKSPFLQIAAFALLGAASVVNSQTFDDSLKGFENTCALQHLKEFETDEAKEKFLARTQRAFIKSKYGLDPPAVAKAPEQPEKPCHNIDFEKNDLSGWSVSGDYKIVSSGTDPFGSFPTVYPGRGKYSLRLNDNKITGKSKFQAKAVRVIPVTQANHIFSLHFAMVLLNYPHDENSAARFSIRLMDENGIELNCPKFDCYYSFQTGATGADFKTSDSAGINTVYQFFNVSYSPWQSVGLDLEQYSGQNVTLEISCNWCIPEVDWAYCYIDMDCGPPVPLNVGCLSPGTALCGLKNMFNYAWSSPSLPNASTVQCCAVNADGTYTLRCSQNAACENISLLYLYDVKISPEPDFTYTLLPCHQTVSFTVRPGNKGSAPVLAEWQWSDNAAKEISMGPCHTFQSAGSQWAALRLDAANGCSSSISKSFKIGAEIGLQVQNLSQTTFVGNDVQYITYLALCNSSNVNLDYHWTGAGFSFSQPQVNLSVPGIYTVTAFDKTTGCSASHTVIVEASSILQIPNIFTPNGDNSNDYFVLGSRQITGIKALIFDRWGNIVFEKASDSGNIMWDGRSRQGIACAEGVFFYVFSASGKDGKSYESKGNITLLR